MNIPLTLRQPNGQVNEYIYGQFIEHILTCIEGGIYDPASPFSNTQGIRTDVLAKLKTLSPSILRFPGGTITCQYHWEDAVGPMENRIRRKNLIWGGELDPSFGTAEFISLCRELGAEPMICVNMASGTPEEAGNWVEYCNGTGNTHYANLRRSHGYDQPFNVKYWCIGNECNAEPDIGTQHDVSTYIRDAMEFIKFMKLTDRSIKTVIVGCDDDAWNKTVLDALHPFTDYLSYHHYSTEGGMGLYGPFAGEKALQAAVKKLSDLIDTYPEEVTDFNPWYRFPPRSGKIRISIDEWNIWDFIQDETFGLLMTYNWRDALWCASILNLFLSDPHIEIANLAQSVNVMAPIIAQPEGSWFQAIAYPLQLYRHTMLGQRIPVSFESPIIDGASAGQIDALSISAVINVDGQIQIAAVNRDFANFHTLSIHTGAENEVLTGSITILTGMAPDAVCSISECCVQEQKSTFSGNEITLSPGSINLITVTSSTQNET